MMATALCKNPAGIMLPLLAGGLLDLTSFQGQKLVIFFCPAADPDSAASEIRSYERLRPEFEAAGAWVVGILPADDDAARFAASPCHLTIGIDPEGAALRRLAERAFGPVEVGKNGGTFVIDRDGRLRRSWDSCGHAAAALESARERP